MENLSLTDNKPSLPDNASKAVLKSMSLETRIALINRIPSLLSTNSSIPYQFEKMTIGAGFLEINNRQWFICPVKGVENSDNQADIQIICDKKRGPTRRLEKSPDEAYQQLFDAYIKNGTIIKGSLKLSGVPQFLRENKEPEDLKMIVKNLELSVRNTEDYECLVKLVDIETVEIVKFSVMPNTLAILDEEERFLNHSTNSEVSATNT